MSWLSSAVTWSDLISVCNNHTKFELDEMRTCQEHATDLQICLSDTAVTLKLHQGHRHSYDCVKLSKDYCHVNFATSQLYALLNSLVPQAKGLETEGGGGVPTLAQPLMGQLEGLKLERLKLGRSCLQQVTKPAGSGMSV